MQLFGCEKRVSDNPPRSNGCRLVGASESDRRGKLINLLGTRRKKGPPSPRTGPHYKE